MADLSSGELIEAESSENGNRKRKLSGKGDGGDSKMTKKTDNTARDKVFGNSLLVDRIIGYAMSLDHERRLREEFRYRLVNKRFNQAVIRSLREKFRDINIGITYDGKVTLSGCLMGRESLPEFGNFLTNVAKVKIHAIRVIRVDKLYTYSHRKLNQIHRIAVPMYRFHSHLMKMIGDNYEKLEVFTGLDFLCSEEQEKCAMIAVRCREYGPLQLDVLLDAFREQTHHYDTLIVSEYLLEKIAIQCAESAVDKDDCYERMAAIITPNITCRRLVLKLYEKPNGRRKGYFDADSDRLYNPTQSLPREIIDEMVRKWNVKSVKLEFHSDAIHSIVSKRWSKFGYFTEIRFDQPYVNVRTSNYRLDLVEVDLENASLILMAIADEKYRRKNDKSYENLFANVRRVFPTEEMNVKFSMTFGLCHKKPGRTTEMIRNIMNSVWRGNPKDLKMKIDMFSYLDPTFNSYQIPSHFRHRTLKTRMTVNDCHVKELGEWRDFEKFKLRSARGKRYSIVDGINKCQIDFGVFEIMITVSVVDERKQKMLFECESSDTIGDLKRKVAVRVFRSPDEFVLKAVKTVLPDHFILLEHNIHKGFIFKLYDL